MFDDRVTSLLKVVETGSFTEAARELYLTQPAVTRHVKALESELGVTLKCVKISDTMPPGNPLP